jgi:hypothetical protein
VTQREKVFERQIARLGRREAALRRRSDRLTRWRLLSFAAVFALGAPVLLTWGPLPWLLVSLLLLIPFGVSVARHRQVETAVRRCQVWRDLHAAQLARLTLNWDAMPPAPPLPPRLEHPFALDLDLLGPRSLHHLLDTAVSQGGSDRLRDWLLETCPDPARARARQALVRELAAPSMARFRARLQLNARLAAPDPARRWEGPRLLAWLRAQPAGEVPRALLWALLALAPLNVTLLILHQAGLLPPFWLATWALYGLLTLSQAPKIGPLFRDAAYLGDSLAQLGAVFTFLEQYRYGERQGVRRLLAPFLDARRRPSQQLQRARRIMAAAGLRYNPLVAFTLNLFAPWDVVTAVRMAALKRELVDLLPRWLDAWAELEALNGLANFADLNPTAAFPRLATAVDGQGPLFRARAIGHPLIPAAQRVANDFDAPQLGALALITGSNMAGKSSFLRTLGVNICLAQAGGPVLAASLEMVPFRLYASIRVADSVTDGFSFFYAEVRRLKALLDDLRRPDPWPLFFLIDEIFRGTNNRERLIGGRAYVRALAGSPNGVGAHGVVANGVVANGVGAIATHDLGLTALADESALITNMHFRDAVVDGRMVFDYTLRPGPCPTTNALTIMRLAGLPVEDAP